MENIKSRKDFEIVNRLYCKNPNVQLACLEFSQYSKVYQFTNENLAEIYKGVNFTNYYNALCVLSSGDHALNLLYHGIVNIDTFDYNRLTEYYALGFKKNAIEVLDYNHFFNLFIDRDDSEHSIENYVIDCMPDKYKNFWQKVLLACKEHYPNPTVFDLCREADFKYGTNLYMTEIGFNTIKTNLKFATINFKHADINDLPQIFGQYDFIELSNIVTWLQTTHDKSSILQLLKDIYDTNLKTEGEMIFNYEYGSFPLEKDEIYKSIDFGHKLIRDIYQEQAACIRKIK